MNPLLQHLFSRSRLEKRAITLLSDGFFLLLAIWAAFALRLEEPFWLPDLRQLLAAVLCVLATQLLFIRLGLYRAIVRFLGDRAFITVIQGVIASCAFLLVFSYFLDAFLPRSVPVIYGAFAFLFVAGTRLSIRMAVNAPSRNSKASVGIIGAGDTGLQLATALNQGVEYHPVFLVSFQKDRQQTVINHIPVISLEQLPKMLARFPVKRLLLALDENSNVDRAQLMQDLEAYPLPVQTVPSVAELITGRARINDIRDLEIEHLLGRDPVGPDAQLIAASLGGKSILVSGAGGSIGSELCRQIIRHRPKSLVLFELSEYALYAIEQDLAAINRNEGLDVDIHTLLGSVNQPTRCKTVMSTFATDVVYHAAAYKHVPLVEYNVIEGVQNNVFGTLNLAEAAIAAGVERFVLVSTDKAVRPTNVMGASKRMAELVLQGLAQRQSTTLFSMVRFGNVLGSSGSVIPLFRDQIRDGGPVTVTHPEITRYFMTIPEACQLVLQAGSMGAGGEVFLLDMGEPVKIADLAKKLVRLMGFCVKSEANPDGDIEIAYTGLRPGEKLYEELLVGDNPQQTSHPRIMKAREDALSWDEIKERLDEINTASKRYDCDAVLASLVKANTGYKPDSGLSDLVWVHSLDERQQYAKQQVDDH